MISVIYAPEFLEHDTGYGHPEKAKRLTAIAETLKKVAWHEQIEWLLPTSAASNNVLNYIRQVHTPEHIARIKTVAESGGGYLDGDTPISQRSYEVALLAVSAWIDGINCVLQQRPTFVMARPPGHHATPDRAMGFCLFSNAAIAAHYALRQPNIKSVGILDWDVHHGNGTEAIARQNPYISYCSLHQHPCYPYSKTPQGITGQHQNILNLPLSAGSAIADYQMLFETSVLPFFRSQQPDLLIVSAGYDANASDPLAQIDLQPEDYRILTKYVLELTPYPLFGLEGGYHLPALAASVVATLSTCL
ncbi:MAG: histone deacetylase [Cyanobacteria bacterium J06623_7]